MRNHDFPCHFIDREADTIVWFDYGQVFVPSVRLDQIVDVFLELSDPNFLPVAVPMAQIVTNDAVLGVLDHLFLVFWLPHMEHDHCKR